MIKRIKPEELPNVLTNEIVEILAHMANETPQSKEWQDIFDLLNNEDFRLVMDKRSELQKQEHQRWWNSLSDEEKKEEERKGKKAQDDSDGFYGNMGSPEYPE